MDFKDSPEEARFRADVRAWLTKNAKLKAEGGPQAREMENLKAAKAWYQKVADAGFACLTWPKEYGGAGLGPIHNVIWKQEVARYDEPDGYFTIGIGNCGPALMAFASEEQKRELLPKMASAEHVWCQLFSEPSAGSDVAGLRTRAEKQGDNWVINGQKIWTSQAHYSDYGVILCRTDPTVSKYKGMTMFFIDMRQPGVEARPIKQMDGGQHFNEVFFNDAVILDNQRLGEVGGGWGAALTVLMNERLAITGVQPDGFPEFLSFFKTASVDGQALRDDPITRERLADWYCQHAGLRALGSRIQTALSKGSVPGPEASLGKLVGAVMNQEIANFTLQLMGPAASVRDSGLSLASGHFQDNVLFAPGIRLAGGTDEVMRNIIAEQVLGMPQEPRADKGKPFNEIPSGNSAG